MTNANKFNLLLDVVKLMHSLADGLEAVAYAFADSQEIFVDAKEVSKPVETGQPTKQIAEKVPTLADVRAVLAVDIVNIPLHFFFTKSFKLLVLMYHSIVFV